MVKTLCNDDKNRRLQGDDFENALLNQFSLQKSYHMCHKHKKERHFFEMLTVRHKKLN